MESSNFPLSFFQVSNKKNTLYLFSSQLISALCTFISWVLIARMLGTSGQGEWSLYVNLFTLGIMLLSFGIPQAVVHFLANGKMEKNKLWKSALVLCAILSVCFFLILTIMQGLNVGRIFIPNLLNSSFYYLLATAQLFFLLFNQLLLGIFHAEEDFKSASRINLVQALFLLGSYALVYFFNVEINQHFFYSILVVNVLAMGVQFLVIQKLLIKYHAVYLENKQSDLTIFKPLIVFSLIIYFSNLISFLTYKMDVWFINYFEKETSEIGVYSVAVALSQMIWMLPQALHFIIYSSISKKENTKFSTTKILVLSIYVFIISIGFAILGYIVSLFLVPSLFGDGFKNVVYIMPLLLPGIVFYAIVLIISAFNAGMKKVKTNLYATIFGFVICIICDYILIKEYGIKGAAWASSISYFAITGFLLVEFLLNNKISFGELKLFSWKENLKIK